jgi:radical SAM protein with 4Fe4S-binding SPASM domain
VDLAPGCFLRQLEAPSLYDSRSDELYELSPDAFDFLLACARGEAPVMPVQDLAFLDFCLAEDLVRRSAERPRGPAHPVRPAPRPSLRYLEILLTDRCNLRCRHCYLGEAGTNDLALPRFARTVEEFADMQGLRLLLSGGEPLMHPRFWEINRLLPRLPLRAVLLTNGTLVTPEAARRLAVREAQVSLDGMREGHDSLRGAGSFGRALAGARALAAAGVAVSVATMIHRGNLSEFDALDELVRGLGAREWTVDALCLAGRLPAQEGVQVAPAVAGRYLDRYGFGGGMHESTPGRACGYHLAAVHPDGRVAKCGLFAGEAAGHVDEGLERCWARIPHPALGDLECSRVGGGGCLALEECRGGCRFRAREEGNALGRDRYQCAARGIP